MKMTPKCPDCKMDQDECICSSPASAPEGWKDFLQDLTQKISEAMYHTPDYFHRDMVRLAHRAHKLLAAAPTPPVSEDRKDAELYKELIYAVANKSPGESRHQTALRYIRNAEKGSDNAAMQEDTP